MFCARPGDYDNDGDLDLFIGTHSGSTNYAGWNVKVYRNQLFRNDGDAVFTEITGTSIATHDRVTYCAAWGDFDNDGDLDLLIGNGGTISWPPANYGQPNELHRNNGDGTFTLLDTSSKGQTHQAPILATRTRLLRTPFAHARH